jgi:hypothetical protein
MSGYTYRQLEVIRERALGLGLSVEYDTCEVSPDPTRPDPCLSIRPLVENTSSITYYLDRDRLTFLQAWGEFAPIAAKIDAVHAMLTDGFAEESEIDGFWPSPESPL